MRTCALNFFGSPQHLWRCGILLYGVRDPLDSMFWGFSEGTEPARCSAGEDSPFSFLAPTGLSSLRPASQVDRKEEGPEKAINEVRYPP